MSTGTALSKLPNNSLVNKILARKISIENITLKISDTNTILIEIENPCLKRGLNHVRDRAGNRSGKVSRGVHSGLSHLGRGLLTLEFASEDTSTKVFELILSTLLLTHPLGVVSHCSDLGSRSQVIANNFSGTESAAQH